MKVFVGLVLLLPAFAMATKVQQNWGMRDGGEMNISETRQCYVYGQCQEYSLDFSQQADAEGCHSFCGKVDGCNWWSWEPAQSLCLAFDNCTKTGGPSGTICPDCISGEKLCPPRDCHQAKKCEGHFVDSFIMSTLEECIGECDSNDDCNWFTLEKQHDHCILYEDCDLHEESCDTCATGPKYCSHGYHASATRQVPPPGSECSTDDPEETRGASKDCMTCAEAGLTGSTGWASSMGVCSLCQRAEPSWNGEFLVSGGRGKCFSLTGSPCGAMGDCRHEFAPYAQCQGGKCCNSRITEAHEEQAYAEASEAMKHMCFTDDDCCKEEGESVFCNMNSRFPCDPSMGQFGAVGCCELD